MKTSACLTAFLVVALEVTANAQSETRRPAYESLRGIRSLILVVEDVNTLTRPVNSTPDTPEPGSVRAGVEEQLRSAGIEVRGPDDERPKEALPTLHLRLVALKDDDGHNYYALRLWLTQEVILPRVPPVRITATTWETGGPGYGAGHQFFERLICQRVHDFIQARKEADSGRPVEDGPILMPPDPYRGPCPLIKRR